MYKDCNTKEFKNFLAQNREEERFTQKYKKKRKFNNKFTLVIDLIGTLVYQVTNTEEIIKIIKLENA